MIGAVFGRRAITIVLANAAGRSWSCVVEFPETRIITHWPVQLLFTGDYLPTAHDVDQPDTSIFFPDDDNIVSLQGTFTLRIRTSCCIVVNNETCNSRRLYACL